MSTVHIDMAVSLDGFVSGPNGDDAGLHDWYFNPEGHAPAVIDELLNGIGAMVLGHRAFGDQPDGFDTPYKMPHYVVTRTARPPIERGGTTFLFVTTGVADAIAQAKAAAGARSVCIAGGAATAQHALHAGLVDEIQLHVVSKILGGGLRLFDATAPVELERTRVLESPGVTHMRYRVMR